MLIASPAVPQFFQGTGTDHAAVGTAMIEPKTPRHVAPSTSLHTRGDRSVLLEGALAVTGLVSAL